MEMTELYRLIELQEEIVEKLEAVKSQMDLPALEEKIAGMMEISTAHQSYTDLLELLGEDEGSIKMLYCQLEGARRDYDRYVQRGISKEVYVDTMKCFTRFIRECGEKHDGKLFYDRAYWSYRQVAMTLFRVGALEYEFRKHEELDALTIHIPSDADFSPASIDASLAAADEMFKACFPEYKSAFFMCDSWLLSPTLQKLLPETSNIVKFQKRFDMYRVNDEKNACMNWVFQCGNDVDYATLPEKTSLQRNIKAHLLGGGIVGTGYGIIR